MLGAYSKKARNWPVGRYIAASGILLAQPTPHGFIPLSSPDCEETVWDVPSPPFTGWARPLHFITLISKAEVRLDPRKHNMLSQAPPFDLHDVA